MGFAKGQFEKYNLVRLIFPKTNWQSPFNTYNTVHTTAYTVLCILRDKRHPLYPWCIVPLVSIHQYVAT